LRLLNVAAAALNQTPLAWADNQRTIVEAIASARAQGVGVLCLPELCITGYGCEDAFLAPFVRETALAVLEAILPETRGLVVSVGLPLVHDRALFNTSALVADTKLLGFAAKRALANDGIHYEPRWFKPWPAGTTERARVLGVEVPLGDVLFDVGGVRIGFEICEDAWVAERRGAELALYGADLILNPSASHFAFGKHAIRERLVLEGSRAFGVTYLYANLLGNEAGRAIYDGDTLIASGGELRASGRRFSYRKLELTTAVVDLDAGRLESAASAGGGAAHRIERVVVEHSFPAPPGPSPSTVTDLWERSPRLKEEELTRALALALFDYLVKSRSRGFVVSLSGGADSALVACLAAMMVRLAEADLGAGGVAERLSHAPAAAAAGGRERVKALLTTAYQSTRQSSDTTRSAARAVAEALGARHLELDVDELVQGYVTRVEAALGRKLAWDADDLALQNIQARTRAPSVWLLANLAGALLLSTSNRSEAAVGYATMDGDTAGGLSPIAGVDKNFVRSYLRWLEAEGPLGLGPIPALSAVNEQAPTAELRPSGAAQTDEKDLMPYDLLDAIERAAIRDKRSPKEIFALVAPEFPSLSKEQLFVYVERFFRLFARNQWKRERYAPSFHLDDESLDPKTWYRFPILSGGFDRELADLRMELGVQ
jgi:NAD+ synthase (glutamine-hydrolysing)